jgi:hypothetical protein
MVSGGDESAARHAARSTHEKNAQGQSRDSRAENVGPAGRAVDRSLKMSKKAGLKACVLVDEKSPLLEEDEEEELLKRRS